MSNKRRAKYRPVERRRVVGDALLTPGPTVPLPEHLAHGHIPAPAPGEHLWIMTGMWRIEHPETAGDPGVQKFLDLENLITIEGPGCFVCEQVWSPAVAAAPCPGDPG